MEFDKEERSLRKAAEQLVESAMESHILDKKGKVGEMVEKFKKSNPDIDISKITNEHFNHWMRDWEIMDTKR